MSADRRGFLKRLAGASAGSLLAAGRSAQAADGHGGAHGRGVLVDCTRCVGCRRCEKACNQINEDLPRRPPEAFDDPSVFARFRRMDYRAYTVVNRYANPRALAGASYAKFQCMHCLSPACVSACIVGALSQEANGAVTYDASKCIGCRYCMVACPFQVPAYEYGNAWTPKVRKCTFCFSQRLSQGKPPACVEACPMQVMTFGRRGELVRLARQRIKRHPRRYVPHLYGETEVGGTAWMYLAGMPFVEMGFPRLGYHPVPGYTEPVQHMLFKWFLPPLALYGALGGVMWFLGSRRKHPQAGSGKGNVNERQ